MHSESKNFSRRQFLKNSGTGIVAATVAGGTATSSYAARKAPSAMPMRTLGKTGLQVSLLGFGGGSQFLLNKDGEWEPMMERALEVGINYFDTSANYAYGNMKSSEERFGDILRSHRERAIITTKFDARDADGARREFEESLRRLGMDSVDILMLHSIGPNDTAAGLEKTAYRELLRMRDEGLARFIGFSSMDSAKQSQELLENLEFDCVLLAMNATQFGDYAKLALPAARKKNVGVMIMKVMRDIVGKNAKPKELLRHAFSHEGVASVVIAHHGADVFEQNVRLTKRYGRKKMAAVEREALERKVAHLASPHALCWARRGYRDGVYA